MRFSTRALASAAVLSLVLLGACSDEGNNPIIDPTSGASQSPTSEQMPVGPEVEDLSEHIEISTEFGQAPDFEWLNDTPPAGLTVDVLSSGDGEVVPEGGYVKAHYEGRVWGSDTAFDSSFSREDGVAFGLNMVVQGWGQGIPGHTVGSRLLISIPSELGYPDGNANAGINPGDTIVFVVDLLATDEVPGATAVAENASVEAGDLPIAFSSAEGEPAIFTVDDDAALVPTAEPKITVIGPGTGKTIAAGDQVAVAYTIAEIGGDEVFSTWELPDIAGGTGPEVVTIGQGSIIDLAIGQPIGSRAVIEVADSEETGAVYVVDLLAALLTE